MAHAKPRIGRPLTSLELEIMHVLWRDGAASVSAVQSLLKTRLAYTTVQTMLNVLCTKRRVARFRAGPRYIYRPKISWKSAANEAVSNLIKQFNLDSVDDIILAMVRKRLITMVQLRNIADQLSRA